ncbi:serine acetyltransferase 1, chloroplastic-like [Andrographis paniculata]|uniref:serine acetyltransferase 1, chloroplastic-like n=1 Tax=Andrographis paniculata TaxID=175694 RepID=UPI0021E7A8DA|nr:serine acetyltransferase 1, chloroplastic-like [Andrographis paniculata]
MPPNSLRSPFVHISHSYFMPFKNPNLTMATCVHPSRADPSPNIDDNNHVVFTNYVKFCRPDLPEQVTCLPIPIPIPIADEQQQPLLRFVDDDIWAQMKEEARADVEQEPILSNYYFSSILSHNSLQSALANYLSVKLSDSSLTSTTLYDLFLGVLLGGDGEEIIRAVGDDLRAVRERDPACISYVHCFLNFKGFLACQAHRIAHNLWTNGRKILALMIQNRVSEVFAVDIHPGAKIGRGILLDHATGVVVGETAVIGDNVSILHNVTLGGTGKVSGDRHPKIGDGVLIGAGTCVLGNVRIEDGAKIGAGSVVLKQVPARTTAVGNPARLMGGKENPVKLDEMPSLTMDHTSHISEWSDYVI